MQPLFFIHIPKTAGTSLRAALEPALGERLVRAYPPGNRIALKDGQVLFGHYSFGVHKRADCEPNYATVLRDPVSRVCSWYSFMRETNHPLSETARSQSLGEMVNGKNPQLNNHMTSIISGMPVKLDGMAALDAAKEHLSRFAFVTTDEDLQTDLPLLGNLLCAKLARLPHRNKSSRLVIDDKQLQIVHDANLLDLELYEFAMAVAKERRPRPKTFRLMPFARHRS